MKPHEKVNDASGPCCAHPLVLHVPLVRALSVHYITKHYQTRSRAKVREAMQSTVGQHWPDHARTLANGAGVMHRGGNTTHRQGGGTPSVRHWGGPTLYARAGPCHLPAPSNALLPPVRRRARSPRTDLCNLAQLSGLNSWLWLVVETGPGAVWAGLGQPGSTWVTRGHPFLMVSADTYEAPWMMWCTGKSAGNPAASHLLCHTCCVSVRV